MWMDGKLMFVGHHRCGTSSLFFDRFPEGDSHVFVFFQPPGIKHGDRKSLVDVCSH